MAASHQDVCCRVANDDVPLRYQAVVAWIWQEIQGQIVVKILEQSADNLLLYDGVKGLESGRQGCQTSADLNSAAAVHEAGGEPVPRVVVRLDLAPTVVAETIQACLESAC